MDRIILFLNRNIRLILGVVVVLLLVLIISAAIISNKERSPQISIGDTKFNIVVASTDQEKQIGLSDTEVLGENDGMLFVFDKADFYSFWMRNMKFPIDIIYLNGDTVTTVIKNASPSANNENLVTYQPTKESDRVFEVNAGVADKYNIKEGTTLKIDNL